MVLYFYKKMSHNEPNLKVITVVVIILTTQYELTRRVMHNVLFIKQHE